MPSKIANSVPSTARQQARRAARSNGVDRAPRVAHDSRTPVPVTVDLPPEQGEIVRVRQRRYLVEGVTPPPVGGEQQLVRLSCLEDDVEGEGLEVFREEENTPAANELALASRVTSATNLTIRAAQRLGPCELPNPMCSGYDVEAVDVRQD